MGNFRISDQREANAGHQRYIPRRSPARQDPKVADKLIPKDHGFGNARVPLESGISKPTPQQRDADRYNRR